MIGAVKGYRVKIVMSEAVSIERHQMIRAYGAEVVLTPGDQGTDGAIMMVHEMVKAYPDDYFYTEQFSNKHNTLAHYETTAREIWEEAGGEIDYCFVSGISRFGNAHGGERRAEKNSVLIFGSSAPRRCAATTSRGRKTSRRP